VSDFYIRLIPTDKNWQPAPAAAASALAYVTGLFSGPDEDVEVVSGEFYEQITLIDAGENTTRITCSRCSGDISLDWFLDLVEEHGEGIGDRDVAVPCCNQAIPLDSLRYDWPVGFARFEVCAMNPNRDKYELDAAELARVAALLGHPVAQILAHY
jgi:hypothetical protein